MKAFELHEPKGIGSLKLADREIPEPGPGQVLIKLKAASLNYRDLSTITANRGAGYALPIVPLSDGCGEVVKAGEGVSRVAVGDRVCPLFFQGWFAGAPTPEGVGATLGGPLDGCAQEYICLHEDGVSRVPAHLTDQQAACLPCAALTAWRALFVESTVMPGDVVLLEGTGGVSIFGLQFAKAAGAEVIITSSSDEKLARARELGADHTINYKATPEWSREARKLTDQRGVDHVLEVGGAETLPQAIQAVRLGGRISLIGVLSGFSREINIPELFRTNGRIQGITVGSREHFEAMCRAIALHKINPVADAAFPFESFPEALRHMQAQRHFGKIVIEMA